MQTSGCDDEEEEHTARHDRKDSLMSEKFLSKFLSLSQRVNEY